MFKSTGWRGGFWLMRRHCCGKLWRYFNWHNFFYYYSMIVAKGSRHFVTSWRTLTQFCRDIVKIILGLNKFLYMLPLIVRFFPFVKIDVCSEAEAAPIAMEPPRPSITNTSDRLDCGGGWLWAAIPSCMRKFPASLPPNAPFLFWKQS